MFVHGRWLEPKYFAWLEQGFVMTLALSCVCCVVCDVARFRAGARAYARAMPPSHAMAALYVFVFRNSPLLVQLLFWYFGAAALLPSDWMTWLNTPHAIGSGPLTLRWPSFELFAGWIGLTCYTSAFIGEEFRAGMRGVSARAGASGRRARHDAAMRRCAM